MKKTVVLSALAVAALAGTASAVGTDFRLDLAIVHRTGSGATTLTDAQTGGVVIVNPGQRINLELRYRITDLNTADTVSARGLSSAVMSIARSQGWTATRASLTAAQAGDLGAQPQAGAVNPDASGEFDTPPSNTSGLINEFRGGLVTDDDPANGNTANAASNQLTSNPASITPLALSGAAVDFHRSNVAPGTQMWGIYSLWIDVPANGNGDNVITFDAPPDPGTGNRFGYFERTGNTTNPVPQTSANATAGTITLRVIPAPGSMALLGLGGLIAARRRRA